MPDNPTTSSEFPKAYEPQPIEPRWAQAWVEQQLFRADPKAPGPVFSIVIPPPNVTGSIHIGHMLDHTQIDMLTRWHRMRGYQHALAAGHGPCRHRHAGWWSANWPSKASEPRAIGREEFERRVWEWKAQSGGTIKRQMIRLGDSCDWSREKVHARSAGSTAPCSKRSCACTTRG